MNCTYCQSANPENDHRCRRCGRRLTGSAVSAPAGYAPQAMGALALNNQEPQKSASMTSQASSETTRTGTRKPAQTSLFAEEFAPRVIPFDAQQRESLLKTSRTQRRSDAPLDETSEIDQPKREAPRGALKVPPRKQTPTDPRGEQSTLDFLPTPSVQSARTLKTTVEAVIYCDSPVATPIHRALAALLDSSMIFLALGLFLGIFEIFGGPFSWSRQEHHDLGPRGRTDCDVLRLRLVDLRTRNRRHELGGPADHQFQRISSGWEKPGRAADWLLAELLFRDDRNLLGVDG